MTSSCKPAEPGAGSFESVLFDSDSETKMSVEHGITISFEASKPIRGLYLVWDTPHTRWNAVLRRNGEETRKTYGENGFLHDYADFLEAYDSVALEFSGSGAVLCDVYVFSEGAVPEWVQIWRPPHEKADLLVLPARAGDEFLYFGGAIPYYIEKGKSVQVAYMTNLFDAPPKTRELLDALYASGLREYPVISGFPEITASSFDIAAERYDADDFLRFTTELLRRFKPEVVVGQGEYGDGVQMFSSDVTMIACELSGDGFEYAESSEKYGAWDVPKLYLHSNAGSGAENPDKRGLKMDWGDSLYTAGQAFSHYSWRQNRSLATKGAYDCQRFELYRTTVGDDAENNDFFENIRVETTKEAKITAETKPAEKGNEAAKPVAGTDGEKLAVPILSGLKGAASMTLATPAAAVLMIIASMLLRLKKD